MILLICRYFLSRCLEMAFQVLKPINVKKIFKFELVCLKIIRISCGMFSTICKFHFLILM